MTTKPDSQTQKTSSAGMTAAMLAAIATSASSAPGITEQKRLLMELEKKVEEQKKLIEMQKVLFLFHFNIDQIILIKIILHLLHALPVRLVEILLLFEY